MSAKEFEEVNEIERDESLKYLDEMSVEDVYDVNKNNEHEDEITTQDENSISSQTFPKRSISIFPLYLSLIFFVLGGYFYYESYRNQTFSSSCSNSSITKPTKLSLSTYLSFIQRDFSFLYNNPVSYSTLHSHVLSLVPNLPNFLLNFNNNNIDGDHVIDNNESYNLPPLILNTSSGSTDLYVDLSSTHNHTSVIISDIISHNKPKVLTHWNHIQQWKILDKVFYGISKNIGYFDQVLVLESFDSNDSKSFVFLPSNGIETDDIYTHYTPSQSIENLPIHTYLNQIDKSLQSNNESKYFFNGNYRIIEEISELQEETTWKDFSFIEDILKGSNMTLTDIDPFLTILYPNTVLQARYSEYHTFRIQLHGIGTYYIINPDYSKYLYPFPSTHHASPQAQLNFYDKKIQEKLFPRSENLMDKIIEVRVQPGEVLYIPPYHFVHTEARDHTKSNGDNYTYHAHLDIFSPSQDQLILTEAGYVEAKFGSLETFEEKVLVSQIYLVHILSRVNGIKSPKQFSRSLYVNRYSSLYGIDGESESLWLLKSQQYFNCFEDQSELLDQIIKKISREHIVRLAEVVSDALNDPAIRPSIRYLWLSNYLEHVALWAMKDLTSHHKNIDIENDSDKVVLFIRQCMNFKDKIEVVVEVEGPPVIKLN